MTSPGNLFTHNWYHGNLARANSESILLNQRPGLFLVRDSQTLHGGYVLSVSENHKVSHYIITQRNGQYQIGDQTFSNLPEIVDFYRRHFLDTTTLVEAAVRQSCEGAESVNSKSSVTNNITDVTKVKAKYNFPGNDPDDLPFKKNDILTIVEKQEDQWWMAKDCTGKEGLIPVNYVEVITKEATNRTSVTSNFSSNNSQNSLISRGASQTTNNNNTLNLQQQEPSLQPLNREITVPALAEATQDRHPTVYDPSELKFEKGDKILVLRISDSGIWDGQLRDGRKGTFPFRHVKLLTSDPNQISQFKSQMS